MTNFELSIERTVHNATNLQINTFNLIPNHYPFSNFH